MLLVSMVATAVLAEAVVLDTTLLEVKVATDLTEAEVVAEKPALQNLLIMPTEVKAVMGAPTVEAEVAEPDIV